MRKIDASTAPAGPNAGFLAQFSAATAFTFMTSGVFLSGLAVMLGANDILVSYISVIVNLSGVLILAFSARVERAPDRKRLAIRLTVASRLATLLIVLIPAAVTGRWGIPVFVAVVVAAFALQAQTTVVINSWTMLFVAEARRGRFISLRQTLSLAVTVVLSLTLGRIIDGAATRYRGFLILFGIALAVAAAEVVLLARIPGPPAAAPGAPRARFANMLRAPLKNRPFIGFVLYVSVFYLLLYVSDSFTTVYMMRYLKLDYTVITGLQMLISLPQVLLLGLWGRLCDRRGHAFTLTASIWLFIGEGLCIALSNADNYWLTLSAGFLFAAAGTSGFTVAVLGRRYELMPETTRLLHDNFFSAAIGLAFIFGPMLGGGLKGLFAGLLPRGAMLQFADIRLLYLTSAAGIALLQLLHNHKKSKNMPTPTL